MALESLDPPAATAAGRYRIESEPPTHSGSHEKRPDIQGLRCVAVVLVVLLHAGVRQLSGGFVGVDVFFVISGYLITGILTRRLRDHGRVGLLSFYANRARRLLPAAFLTIGATCLATWQLLPAVSYDTVARDAIASATYVENWALAARSVDYLHSTEPPSPFQHFWSLSVEEQFYLVWPALLAVAAFIVVRRRRWLTGAFAVAMAAIFVPSLIYSISQTKNTTAAAQAYFITPTRMWELALGGGLAIAAPAVGRAPRIVLATLAWLGLAAIAWSAVAYDASTAFPGSAALAPTLGAAAVLAGGLQPVTFGPVAVLGLRPLTAIGDISYSLYLWHWPVLILAARVNGTALSTGTSLLLAAAAVIPATLSYRYIERPVQRARRVSGRRRGIGLGVICSAAGAACGLALLSAIPAAHTTYRVSRTTGQIVDSSGKPAQLRVGAEVLLGPHAVRAPQNTAVSISPDPIDAINDMPHGGTCIQGLGSAAVKRCDVGDLRSKTVIDLVGDSHAMQWMSAIELAGDDHHWHVVTHTHEFCPLNAQTVAVGAKPYKLCDLWNLATMKDILREHPALVLTSAETYDVPSKGSPLSDAQSVGALIRGYHKVWTELVAAGIPVAVIEDTPVPNFDMVGCVETHPRHLLACAGPRANFFPKVNALHRAAATDPHVTDLDFNNLICPWSRCAGVIGNVLVWRDNHHLSNTYAVSLHEAVGQRIAALLHRPKGRH